MRVVTFGELMLRLTPPGYRKLVQAEGLRIHRIQQQYQEILIL